MEGLQIRQGTVYRKTADGSRFILINHNPMQLQSMRLHENGNAFIVYRYACERKDMCGHIDFLFALADILKFVYESLARENNITLS